MSLFLLLIGLLLHTSLSSVWWLVDSLRLTAEEGSTDHLLKHFRELEYVPDSSPKYFFEDILAVETFNDTTTHDFEEHYIVCLPYHDSLQTKQEVTIAYYLMLYPDASPHLTRQ